MKENTTSSITIWDKDIGFVSPGFHLRALKSVLFSNSTGNQTFQKVSEALKKIASFTDLLKKSLKGASGLLGRIYLGQDNRPENRRRIAQCFKDIQSQDLHIFLDGEKLIRYHPATVLYLMAHELEHACQYQRKPIASLDDKTKPEKRRNDVTEGQRKEEMMRDCVIETDATAVGLAAFIVCGGTEEEYRLLKKELPMLADALPEYDEIKGKEFDCIVHTATKKILPWRWNITQHYLKDSFNLDMPAAKNMETDMVRAPAVFHDFIFEKEKSKTQTDSILRENGR